MKKLLLGVVMILAIVLMAIPAMAVDLGKNISFDGYATLGKQFDSEYQSADRIGTLTLTTKENEWYIEMEAGLKVYNLVRPFFGYRALTDIFLLRTAGVDVMAPLSYKGINAGVRASYNAYDSHTERYTYGFSGLVLKW